MKFIVANLDGSRVLCQLAGMAAVQWIDARVAEAIGYSYAVTFETRRGADRCAFMHNGAVVALGEWDMTKAIERVLAAAHVVCGPHKDLGAVNSAHEALAKALAAADPHGVYKTTAPATGEDSPDVSLRDSPRLSKLIGGLDSLTHD